MTSVSAVLELVRPYDSEQRGRRVPVVPSCAGIRAGRPVSGVNCPTGSGVSADGGNWPAWWTPHPLRRTKSGLDSKQVSRRADVNRCDDNGDSRQMGAGRYDGPDCDRS